jgi:hypothetical protein
MAGGTWRRWRLRKDGRWLRIAMWPELAFKLNLYVLYDDDDDDDNDDDDDDVETVYD